MLVRWLCLGSLVLVLSLAARAAHADGSELPEGYAQLIDEAVKEAAQAHFTEARALFAEAHALYPNARTLRGLGIMAYELRSYAESMAFYEQALAAKERPLDGALRADALAMVERARRFVAELTLAVAPADTRIVLDDASLTLSPGKPVRIDPGPHTLRFEAPGYVHEERSVEVRGGESLSWNVSLKALAPVKVAEPAAKSGTASGVALAAAGESARDQPSKKPLYKNPWLWTGVALAVSAIAVGVGVAAKSDPKSVPDQPATSRQTPVNGVLLTLGRRP